MRVMANHNPQEVILAQFSLYVHRGGLMPDLFHFLHTRYMLYYIRPKTDNLYMNQYVSNVNVCGGKSFLSLPIKTRFIPDFTATFCFSKQNRK